MLSLMQPTQEPKSVNYRLLFTVWRYISISKAITRAFFFFFLNSQKTLLYVNISTQRQTNNFVSKIGI
jgi:hypothetical protein